MNSLRHHLITAAALLALSSLPAATGPILSPSTTTVGGIVNEQLGTRQII